MKIPVSETHSFDINVAAEYGIEEAILISHFQYWIGLNKRKNQNYHEDRYWTYQTKKDIAAHYPYLNERKVKYTLEKLISLKILRAGNFNKKGFDKTVWYSFENQKMFTKDKIVHGGDEIVPPIPDTLPDTIKDIPKGICKEEEKKKTPIKKKEIKFNRDTQTFENIPEEFLSSLESSFPLVDKDLAFQKMIIWLNGHNNRRASKEFIKKWFTGDQESAEYRKSRNCYSRRVQEKQEWEEESNSRPDKRVENLKKAGSYVEADPDEETVNFMDSLNQHLNQEDTNETT